MKLSKVHFLGIFLIIVLALFTFFGTSSKEGILFRDLSTIKVLLNDTTPENASKNIELFKKMDISDQDFKSILYDNEISDEIKAGKLKILVATLLMGKTDGGYLSDVINKDITLNDIVKNSHKIRL